MDEYDRAFIRVAQRLGYRDATLIDGVWCVDGRTHPDCLRAAPPRAPKHMRAIPGTDQMRIGRIADLECEDE